MSKLPPSHPCQGKKTKVKRDVPTPHSFWEHLLLTGLTLPCIEDNGLIPVPIWTRPFSISCDFRRLEGKHNDS